MATHTTSMTSTSTSAATSTVGAASPTNTSGSSSSNQKPLLFFVALGFGVVFTNLWIIVGVKYCFRYNRRARRGLVDHDNGDPIGLGNVPRPRRRREKKLMTMEEVNERFPLTKYKLWRATREQEGLPAEGGITAAPSRAASVKGAALERISTDHDASSTAEATGVAGTEQRDDASSAEEHSQNNEAKNESTPHEVKESSDAAAKQDADGSSAVPTSEDGLNAKEISVAAPPTVGAGESTTLAPISEKADEKSAQSGMKVTEVSATTPVDEEEDDPIRTALPTELIAQPGDSCAICLDTLDDDDDVRGLTCGHAFHAGCLDPWLTSRRACCPLCKADYYVPKIRPEGESAAGGSNSGANARSNNNNNNNPDMPTAPRAAFVGGIGRPTATFRPRMVSSGTRYHADARDRYGFPVWRPMDTRRNSTRRATEISMATTVSVSDDTTTAAAGAEQEQQQQHRSFRERYMDAIRRVPRGASTASHFRAMAARTRHLQQQQAQTESTDGTTPSQQQQPASPATTTTTAATTTTTTTTPMPTPSQLEAGTRTTR